MVDVMVVVVMVYGGCICMGMLVCSLVELLFVCVVLFDVIFCGLFELVCGVLLLLYVIWL